MVDVFYIGQMTGRQLKVQISEHTGIILTEIRSLIL